MKLSPKALGQHGQLELRLAPDEIIVDSFAGGGGASLGIHWALGRGPHIAINHDREAIALHAANHPDSEHYPEDVWHVDPVVACRGRKVGLMWLSPDCKHFSKAKGGKPVSKKIRGLAWTACRWAKAVRPRVIVLENVEEFKDWGPLIVIDGKLRPDPARKGYTFRRFVRRLERLGYVVDWRELRACDFGAPTIRKRFFLIARCDSQPIVWPEATHGPTRDVPWRTAAECIDWSIACPSIFERVANGKKALADNTLKRIARGVQRYVIDSPKPFIVPIDNASSGAAGARSVSDPLSTVTAEARHAIAVPVIAGVGGRAGQSPERPLNKPYQTITAKADAALVAPYLARVAHGERDANGRKRGKGEHVLGEPLPTQTGSNEFGLASAVIVPTTHQGDARAYPADEPIVTVTGAHRGEHALVAPFLKPRYGEDPNPKRRGGKGQAPRVRSLEEPAPVIVPTGNGGDLVAAFMAQHNTDVIGHAMTEPVSTIVGKGCTQAPVTVELEPVPTFKEWYAATKHLGGSREEYRRLYGDGPRVGKHVAASSIVKLKGTAKDGQAVDEPLHTVQAGGNHYAEVRAFLIAYYGNERDGGSLNDPARTLTAKERFGLVTVAGVEYAIVDIGMRMLAPRELYRAQGFPDTYRIDIEYNGKPMTKTAQVRMCGNSVCPPMAYAIVRANLFGETFAPAGRDAAWDKLEAAERRVEGEEVAA